MKKKRILSMIMALLILVSSSITVYADSPEDVGKDFVKLKYVLTQLGCLFSGNLDDMIANSEKFQQFQDGNIPVSDDGKGNITIDNSTVNNIYNVAKEEVTKLNGYYLVEPAQSVADFFFSMKDGFDFSVLEKWRTTFKEYSPDALVFPYQDGHPYARLPAYPVVGFFISGEEAKGYSTSKGAVQFGVSYYKTSGFGPYGWEKPSTGMAIYNVTVEEFKQKLICDSPVKLFYTQQDLLYYLNYGGRVYLTNNFNNYNNVYDHSITYKDNVINNTDWNQVNNNIYNEIYNNYQNTPESDRQDLIDQKYDEILSALGDIGGNVENMNQTLSRWLERIYKKVDSILNYIKNPTDLMQEVINKMDEFSEKVSAGFTDIIEAIKGLSGGGSGVGSGIGSTIGTIIGNLLSDWIKGILEEALDAGGNVVDAVNSIVDNLGTTFAPVRDVAKSKFPFSLPWDLYACIKLLDAKPEMPVYRFSVKLDAYKINEEVVLDFKEFETLSKLSRAFFTITYILVLINFTLKITQREDL